MMLMVIQVAMLEEDSSRNPEHPSGCGVRLSQIRS
jgi:hypothetical protein